MLTAPRARLGSCIWPAVLWWPPGLCPSTVPTLGNATHRRGVQKSRTHVLPKRAVLRQLSPVPTNHLDIFQPCTPGSVDATARNSRIGLAPRQKIPVLVPLHSQMHSWATLNDVSSPACGGEYEHTREERGAHDAHENS